MSNTNIYISQKGLCFYICVSSHKVGQHHHQLQWCIDRLDSSDSFNSVVFVCVQQGNSILSCSIQQFDERVCFGSHFFFSAVTAQTSHSFLASQSIVFFFLLLSRIYKYKSWAKIKETYYERVIDSIVGISQHFLGMRIKCSFCMQSQACT